MTDTESPSAPVPPDPREPPTPEGRTDRSPWIESREGGLFFVNALVATPAGVVLLPLVLGWLLRALGALEGPSRVFDTIPAMAAYFLPRVGWLALPAAWLAWKGVREIERPSARAAVAAFLVVHLATLAWTVAQWVT